MLNRYCMAWKFVLTQAAAQGQQPCHSPCRSHSLSKYLSLEDTQPSLSKAAALEQVQYYLTVQRNGFMCCNASSVRLSMPLRQGGLSPPPEWPPGVPISGILRESSRNDVRFTSIASTVLALFVSSGPYIFAPLCMATMPPVRFSYLTPMNPASAIMSANSSCGGNCRMLSTRYW